MAAEARGRTMTRMLIAVLEGEEPSGIAHLARLIGLAGVQGVAVRIAYFHRIPRDRRDGHDRIVVDRHREMRRIEEAMREAVAGALRAAGRGPVECVVRFGAPVVEVEREAEAFGADAVAFAPGPGLRARWRGWRIRRGFAARADVRLLVLEGGAEVRLPARVADRLAVPGRGVM
jgi:nucleotide-binding universal stress UspA family protein